MESFVRDLSRSLSADVSLLNKTHDARSVNTSRNNSSELSRNSKSPARTQRLPSNRTPGRSSRTGTPSSASRKTPRDVSKKTPSKDKSPGRDRFIPQRSAQNFQMAYHKINSDDSQKETNEYQRTIKSALNVDQENGRIIAYSKKVPSVAKSFFNPLREVYKASPHPNSSKKTTRHISQDSDRILDAPELVDDYYLNLMDWSVQNKVAIALRNYVYLWDAHKGDIKMLLNLDESTDEYVSSVKWGSLDSVLAVGTSSGEVQLWDAGSGRMLRVMSGHSDRPGALSWNGHVLTSGCRDGYLHHHDVRIQQHLINSFPAHSQEICGLEYSPRSQFLASGANDNFLKIWSVNPTITEPIHTFSDHQAAVKALSWCPWQANVLASGGGSADRHIRFWNVSTGVCMNNVNTNSQVCGIKWCEYYKEIISGHGYAKNQLTIWKYPTMTKVTELLGHSNRILHVTMSPDSTVVASAGADETLRLWKCFAVDAQQKKKNVSSHAATRLSISNCIR